MPQNDKGLSSLLIQEESLKLERNLLKDLAADALRDHISIGRIPEGTKLTEREVSQMLGISRMPVHDALIMLEAEGLVVRRANARYVISLTEKDVRDLHVARKAIEREAVVLAATNINTENRATLYASLEALEGAIASEDRHLSAKCDMALHQTICDQANNKYLSELLRSLMGVIFVLNDRVRAHNKQREMDPRNEHRALVEHIVNGDAVGAATMMEMHLDSALTGALATFRI